MDAVSGERGQALVFAVLLLAVAAGVLVATRDAAARVLDGVRADRAGEAAVTAAAAAVADLAAAKARSLGHELDAAETAAFAADERVATAARAAAARLARLNGGEAPSRVRVRSYGLELEVELTLAGRGHVALLEPPP